MSRRILEALAEADWARTNPRVQYQLAPPQVFQALGLTPQDGWKPPQNFQELPAVAKKWLKENAGTYRIKRLVPAAEE